MVAQDAMYSITLVVCVYAVALVTVSAHPTCTDNSQCPESRCCSEQDRLCIYGLRERDFCLPESDCRRDIDCDAGQICILGHCHDENGNSARKCDAVERELINIIMEYEKECTDEVCGADQWRCVNRKQCIEEKYTTLDGNTGRCDGNSVCLDGSDESNETCRCWDIYAHTADKAWAGSNEIYIDLIDTNETKSVERRLAGDTIERGKTSKFRICTPRDENLGELKSAEMSERDDDAWIIDKLQVYDIENSILYTHEPVTRSGTDKIDKQTKNLEFQTQEPQEPGQSIASYQRKLKKKNKNKNKKN